MLFSCGVGAFSTTFLPYQGLQGAIHVEHLVCGGCELFDGAVEVMSIAVVTFVAHQTTSVASRGSTATPRNGSTLRTMTLHAKLIDVSLPEIEPLARISWQIESTGHLRDECE